MATDQTVVVKPIKPDSKPLKPDTKTVIKNESIDLSEAISPEK
jgi:hypothetical protein